MRLGAGRRALAVCAKERLQIPKREDDTAGAPHELVVDHAERHRTVAVEFGVAANSRARAAVAAPNLDAREVPEVVLEVSFDGCMCLTHGQLGLTRRCRLWNHEEYERQQNDSSTDHGCPLPDDPLRAHGGRYQVLPRNCKSQSVKKCLQMNRFVSIRLIPYWGLR